MWTAVVFAFLEVGEGSRAVIFVESNTVCKQSEHQTYANDKKHVCVCARVSTLRERARERESERKRKRERERERERERVRFYPSVSKVAESM